MKLPLCCGFKKTVFWLSLVAFVGFLAAASYGYVLGGSRWPSPAATFRFNPNFTDTAAQDPATQYTTLAAAMNNWNSKSNFVYTDGGMTTLENQVNDGVNQVHYKSGASSGAALAVTTTWFVGNTTQDTDIRYFDMFGGGGGNIVWAINPNGSQYDIKHVGVHEWGHALGLDHSAQANAIMFATSGSGNLPDALTLDDMLGLTRRYGHPTVSISSVSPNRVTALQTGQVVTVNGGGFVDGATQVFLRRNDSNPEDIHELTNVTFISPTQVSCEIPPLGTGTAWPVAVLVSGNQSRDRNSTLIYDPPPAPSISSINPASGPEVGGGTITIQGANFTILNDLTVTFGGVEATVDQVTSSGEIEVTAPPGGVLGFVDVAVTSSGGTATASNGYEFTENPPNVLFTRGMVRVGRTAFFELQGPPNRNCALLADGQTGSAVKGGLTLGLACTPKFTLIHNSFSGGDDKLDAVGRREVALAIPSNPNLAFATFHLQGVISPMGGGPVTTQVLTLTIFP